MSQLSALIVDDEPLARQSLARHLSAIPDVLVVGQCATGTDALKAIAERNPDVVFLDVQMPELDGIGLARQLLSNGSGNRPAVVFVTAYEAHAVQAFRARAVDYLLKPVDPDQLREAIARVRGRLPSLPECTLETPTSARPSDRYSERLVIRLAGRTLIVPVRDVDWIDVDDNHVQIHVGTTVHRVRSTLATLERQLNPHRFARIHRSTIVNLDRVREIQPWFRGDSIVLLTNGAKLSVGPTYREAFMRALPFGN